MFTCVRVYLSTWFPAARLAGLPVSIPRPRGDASRMGMESPVLFLRSPCGLARRRDLFAE